MNILDPAAVMTLLVVVSLAVLIGLTLVAVLVAHEYAARRRTRASGRQPVTTYSGKLAVTH